VNKRFQNTRPAKRQSETEKEGAQCVTGGRAGPQKAKEERKEANGASQNRTNCIIASWVEKRAKAGTANNDLSNTARSAPGRRDAESRNNSQQHIVTDTEHAKWGGRSGEWREVNVRRVRIKSRNDRRLGRPLKPRLNKTQEEKREEEGRPSKSPRWLC